jgi:hypothetical protein
LEQQHGASFNYIHISTAFSRAGHIIGAGTQATRFHPLLRRLWARLQPQLDECGEQALANIVWACGKAAYADPPLLDACLNRLVGEREVAAPQGLANALYGAALLWGNGMYRIDKQQAQQLVAALVQQRQGATSQNLSNTLWAAAAMGLLLPDQQAQQLVAAPVQQRHAATPQGLSNTLWAAATMGLQLSKQQAQQLVEALVRQRQAAKPQGVSNTLWAAATMGLPLQEQQAQQLVEALVQQRQSATSQNLSNTLWAVATMGLPLPEQQAQQLVAALVQQRHAATPQAVSNTLWAVATIGLPLANVDWHSLLEALVAKAVTAQNFSNTLWAAAKRKADFAAAPRTTMQQTRVELALLQLADAAVSLQLVEGMTPQNISNSLWALSELGMRPDQLTSLLMTAVLQRVAAMTPQDISITALAAARLGYVEAPLFEALMAAAQQRRQESAQDEQAICNLCWAVVVADEQQLTQQVVALSKQLAASGLWESGSTGAGRSQLWQVHLWLLDCKPRSGGLAGTLSAQQLQQCADVWELMLQQTAQQRRTVFEQGVLAAAQQLPGLAACCQEARTDDGAYSVDVIAMHTATGRRLAIEADGPHHFLLPGRQPTGDTLARDRALAARGYVVVSVPWWKWNAMQADAAQHAAYLRHKVAVTLQKLGAGRPPGAGPAAAA